MSRPFIQIQDINGHWVVLVMRQKEILGTATADTMAIAFEMAGELYESCREWPPEKVQEFYAGKIKQPEPEGRKP